ncbi:alpha,alpha-trehalose-phosphate synthase (UDP-forming) [Rhinocladiella mackenziei CBS 650.93]|uniref:Alpha,alpha-trehalose-phosphate synthase (UDP-forming) n=1 Tax=Rhinocladiella mackenziei CBS 650.93 TaxID=1442369 RepID=A0A0D2JCM1_9EURO|nr:alpha,alpha-trehalose-phosphate synthase (UDP-forming) [Rhinocladiella mackenziei CBS 650.93]KIX06860.1 alpha,alpha-trehalose-phosphate synthase (UDP-forming) [Rhinocladiella mackenziei CBS 650.93]
MNSDLDGRVLVVANRLPITTTVHDDGTIDYSMATGGLVSGLRSLAKAVDFKWFGWPGVDIHRNDKDGVRQELRDQFNAVPIFLTENLAQRHYNGFCNSVLWPLMHRMPDKVSSDFEDAWATAYREVNEIFADNIVPLVEDGDLIWIHDYHLLLLPGILRDRLHKKKGLRIGFFLHTPFPSEDYFTILPFRESICRSLLLCDVVGFHTDQYARDFLDSARIVLEGVSNSLSDLHWNGRRVVVHGFPIGIEPQDFKQRIRTGAVQREIGKLEGEFRDQKILVGVDRLDYIKGISLKLKAFDRFLTDHPEWVGKVTMIQLAIPTRAEVVTYQKLREEVERLIGHVNGKHGTFSHTPIHYLYRSVSPEQLCALYAASDVCIIASVRDGLNMVSYEYAACQEQRKGVLMMSHYAGAVKTLPECVVFNPWDTPRFAERINQVLNMPMEERERRHGEIIKVVDKWTSVNWGTSFLNTMITMEIPPEDALPDQDAGPQLGCDGHRS